MDKRLFVGIDVSAKSLEVAWRTTDQRHGRGVFSNDAAGHKKLIKVLGKFRLPTRIVLEATGIYGLDLALALDETPGFAVMVANPRAISEFGKAKLQRSKTDRLDAAVILEFAERMPFVAWRRPSVEALEVRAITRRTVALTEMIRGEKSRRHAAEQTDVYSAELGKSIDKVIRMLTREIAQLRAKAVAVVRRNAILSRRLDLLVSIKGVGEISAIGILAELTVLPEDMTDRQWVAHAGLDPRRIESGTSVRKKVRISKAGNKYLRATLYLPAVTAARHDPQVAAYAHHLASRGKTAKQIHVAVMRKLLHAIHGMFRNDAPFNPSRFFGALEAAGVVGTSEIAS